MIIDSCLIFNIDQVVAALGDLTFNASSVHGSVTNYQVRVRYQGTSTTILAMQDLGRPTPNEAGVITVNLQYLLNGLTPGNYEVSVATTTPGGTTDSTETTAFSVPLS